MPRQEGVMYECSRCHKKEFIPYQPLQYKYDILAGEWYLVNKGDDIWLCPGCRKKFEALLNEFLNVTNI